MEIWAAIDVLGGSVVTLRQGRASEVKTWGGSPLEFARRWQSEGAGGLHVIDLDAAFQTGSNKERILEIVGDASVPVQVGGGVRDRKAAEAWLDSGAERVVLGTVAFQDPNVLTGLLHNYGPSRVVVATDYRDGKIVTRGWTEDQGLPIIEAVERMEGIGVSNILTTSVGRDGLGLGPDLGTTRSVCKATLMNVIASGGIRDLGDIMDLEEAGAEGVVLGRSIYEGGIKMSEARRLG